MHMLLRRFGLATLSALLVLSTSACDNKDNFKAQIKPQLSNPGGEVDEITQVKVSKAKVGPAVTTQEGQKIDIDCTVTITTQNGDAKPVTKTYKVGLHAGPLPKGTPFELDCQDPVIFEVPLDASGFVALASPVGGGGGVRLPIVPSLTSIPISAGVRPTRLYADRGTQLVQIGWANSLGDGIYTVSTTFKTKRLAAMQQKMIVAAHVQCGNATYLQPLLPLVSTMRAVPAVTIPVSSTMKSIKPPAISQPANSSVHLTCGR